jgi:nickel/cobalt exporter
MTGLLTAALSVPGFIAFAAQASAHPLDETVQQAYLTPSASGLAVELDISPNVLVAPGVARSVDVDGNGTLSATEIATHAAAVQSKLSLRVDGHEVALRLVSHSYPDVALLTAGGGVITLTWSADLPAAARGLEFHNGYEPGRTVVQAAVLTARDPVPIGQIGHADDGRTLTAALNAAANEQATPAPTGPGAMSTDAASTGATAGSTMFDALRRPLTGPWALAALLGACVLLGALHALTPGHGKALLASYLVGARGTPRHAVVLGLVTTLTHTAAVIAVGLVLLVAGRYLVPGAVVPGLTLAAGLVVLVLGLRLIRARLHAGRVPAAVEHGHEHGHGHGHGPDGALMTRPRMRGVAVLGMTAGIVPCPEALGVLVLAVGLQRTALGLVMIVAFSVGLAAVLVGLGLVLVTARPLAERLTERAPRWLATRVPLASAVVVVVLGAVMTVTAVGGLLA